jgi:hypothetical protein
MIVWKNNQVFFLVTSAIAYRLTLVFFGTSLDYITLSLRQHIMRKYKFFRKIAVGYLPFFIFGKQLTSYSFFSFVGLQNRFNFVPI